ncbi:MAG TPA: class I SAM-dependent rRNA methyltransferase [Terracidiphilus sp.]|jgi:23S rRNA (cytosine1962-C5)-methyltransferase|nr:class I SAM-dependent rRNA methyltransferase [Terracidiphilus sp.]
MTKLRTTHASAHQKAQSAKKPGAPSLQSAKDTGAREPAPGAPSARKATSRTPLSAAREQKSVKAAFGARISRRASDRLRSGHLWVYASDVEHLEAGEGDAPVLLPVADNRGLLLGTALYSPSSQIALRMVAREAVDEKAWLKLLEMRLRAAIAQRRRLLSAETDSCRLCFSEADELPGLVVDKYGDLVIVQRLVKGLLTGDVRAVCARVLREELEPASILERPDPKMRELEGLAAPDLSPVWVADPQAPKMSTLFRLHGMMFHFDANAGQKTGAFLDQRANYEAARDWARRLGTRERALDVCCYQGGFALHLAEVCRSVTGIDASHSSLEVAERNVEANRARLPAAVDWVEADAFQILRDWSDAGEKFDAIVLDPPAFAKSKRAVEGALRGYKELNLRALKMLTPGGLLVTCSCSHHVSWADLEGAVAAAANDAHRRVRLLERRGAALDHPVVLNLPETEYLKCLVLAAD